MTLDASELRVLVARLEGIADEMGAVLRRAAFSPNIKERADCSAAVFDAQGRLLAQAEHIPVHLGSLPASVEAVIDACGELVPGTQAIVNDPFAGGTHLNDVTLVAPCWLEGELVGWVANRAHHADVGGAAPGSLPADATDVHQEGLRLPPVVLTDGVRQVLLANSRTPWERAGDLAAQVGANEVGVRRLAALAGQPFGEVVDYGERRSRSAIAALPDGTYRAVDVLDSVGPRPDQQHPATIECVVRVDGESIEFDLSGSDDQRVGNTNAVRAVTVSAVAFVVRAVLDASMPSSAGTMLPVRVTTRPGSIVSAEYPCAVGAGNVEVSQRIADVCFAALARAVPERVPAASQGTMNNLLIGAPASDERPAWVYYETIAGGQGGRPPDPSAPGSAPRPGMSGVHTGMTNTLNTPVEALERSYSMRVRSVRLRSDSGGHGAAPGGDGIEREIEVLQPCTVSLITERRVSRPWGLEGGGPGAVGENWLLPAGDDSRAERLPDKCTIEVAAGDVIRMLTPGGGGWGEPTG